MARKLVVISMLSIVFCIGLSSCGVPAPPKEKRIIQDLPREITEIIILNPFDLTNMDIYEMDVETLSIEKRQTNEKEDFVYCIVDLENKILSFYKVCEAEL